MTSHPTAHTAEPPAVQHVDHSIAGPGDRPANFSHWEPGPDTMRAPSVAVDGAGHRWQKPDGDDVWVRLPAADQRDDHDEF